MSLRALVFAIGLVAAGCATASPVPASAKARVVESATVEGRSNFARRLLEAHNVERARLGLPPLVWNPVVAEHAQAWAAELARSGRYEHSSNESRPDEGENIFRHFAGAYTPEQMVGTFLAERAKFMPGVFPNIARNGDWTTAGHYSQVIWPTTTQLGCGLAVAHGMDYLVCRYSPAGNLRKHRVG